MTEIAALAMTLILTVMVLVALYRGDHGVDINTLHRNF